MPSLDEVRVNDGAREIAVLHCIAPGVVGGLESVVRALASGLRAREHDVHVAAVVEERFADLPWLRELEPEGVGVHVLALPGRAYLREWRELGRVMDVVRPHVVHTHGYRSDVIAGAVARWRRLPTITTVHGFTGGGSRNRFYERLQRRAFRRFDAVVAVSRPLESLLLEDGVRRARLHMVRNALPAVEPMSREAARRALGLDDDPAPRIGWIGRVSHEKGADVMVEAFARLPGDHRLSFVGDGPMRAAAAERAAALGIEDRITWHGTVMGAARLLRAFDLVVLSSRTEGTPIVLLEAMQGGVPVVATRVGGVPDVLSVEEGWVVPAESPEELAAAVRVALADRVEAARRAGRGRERMARDFAAAPWIDRYEELYRALARRTDE